jgi:hypothetical protein
MSYYENEEPVRGKSQAQRLDSQKCILKVNMPVSKHLKNSKMVESLTHFSSTSQAPRIFVALHLALSTSQKLLNFIT